ncbi:MULTISPECIES: M50 family metallopeptidase [Bhargavaea]|uniref:M50 family metallopeptidase n=1 Tax=Bhargavaea changchunensis TaxID=2134037 RepID=A0ABW2NBL6_9BACL|nr:M50 family metallopeptidase [Bhargavaea sp. CC-171006]
MVTASRDKGTGQKKKSLGQTLAGLAIGVVLWPVFLPYLFIHEPVIDLKNTLVILTAIVVSAVLALIIHEFGHAIAGAVSGMKFMNMSIGPLVVIRSGEKNRIIFQKPALGYLGRAMLRFPAEITAEQMENVLKRYVAGGPAANIIAATISVALVYTILPSGVLLTFAIVNLLLGAANLIPSDSKGMMTDGKHLSMLAGKTPGKELVLISYRLMQEDTEGTDWSPETVRTAEELVRRNPDHPLTPALYASLSPYYISKNPLLSEELGREIAFRERPLKIDPLQDMADIAMIHTLHAAGLLSSEPEIRTKLSRIGETEKVTRLFRDAYSAILDRQADKLNDYLDELEHVLGEWHSLYLEGIYEKERVLVLRNALRDCETQCNR